MAEGKLPDARTRQGAFLFLVGIILSQNVSGAQAWRGVCRLAQRCGLRAESVRELSVDELERVMAQSPAIHPFTRQMARAIVSAAERVCGEYAGDARQLWRTARGPDDARLRLTQFRQIGMHKASVAAYLLSSVYGELAAGAGCGIEAACPALASYLA